jgi:5-methyltetrahydropteroyltriglutamate--homocysteine methyltransferase
MTVAERSLSQRNTSPTFGPLATTIVGSYPQPEWLIDRERLGAGLPPRIRLRDLWRVPTAWLDEAQDAAALIAISDQELAGVDLIGDGEVRRESYSNRLANALEGIDIDNPGIALDRTGKSNLVPRVVGAIARKTPIDVAAARFLRERTKRPTKVTLPGPFTLAQQAQNDFYADDAELALAYAAAVNEEIKDLFAAGIDIVQLDEPYLQARPEEARAYGLSTIARALRDVEGVTALHICFGYAHVHRGAAKPSGYAYLAELSDVPVDILSIEAAQPKLDPGVLSDLAGKTIMYGVVDLNDPEAESPTLIAERVRAALRFVRPERLIVTQDCGLKYLSRSLAFAKMQATVEGAAIVRAELAGLKR